MLLGGLILYALYLVAGNIFLNSPLGRHVINRKAPRYHAEWSWAMTLYPGHIHARDIVMGGHVRKTLWTARSPSADGRIVLWPLLRRELRFAPISADAVTLDVDRSETDLRPPPRLRKPWRLHFDAIATRTLRSLRYGKLIVEGAGNASFALDKELRGGPIEVLPSRLTMPDARVRYGGVRLLEHARLDFRLALPPHTREQVPGLRKIGIADARLIVTGEAPGIRLDAGKDGALSLGRPLETGRMTADLSLDHGTLVSGGRLHWSTPIEIQQAKGVRERYRAQLDVLVGPQTVALRALIPPQGASGNHLDADLRLADRRLEKRSWEQLAREMSGKVDLQWHFVSLSWLNPMLSDTRWLRLDGAADVIAALRIQSGQLLAGSRVEIPRSRLEADVLDNVFSGTAHATAKVTGVASRRRSQVDIGVDDFVLAPGDARGAAYLRGRDLRLALASSADLARFRNELQADLAFDNASIPDLRSYNRHLPGNNLRLLGGSGTLSGRMALDAAGEVGTGRLSLTGKDASIALGVSRLIGDIRLDTRLARVSKKAGRLYDLDGFALDLDGVRATGSQDPPWWARFKLDRARLAWKHPFSLDGQASLDMKDASVLLDLFADRGAFPKWIGNIVDDGHAKATGRLRMRDDEVVLDDIVASNDRVDLKARLRIARGQPGGDLYARWGALGLGVELEGGQRKFHLAGARKWYEAQPALLPDPPR